jgi:hypothetical protein
MANDNFTVQIGNLTDNPELRFTQNGTPGHQLRPGRQPAHQGPGWVLARRGDQLLPRQRLARPSREHRRIPGQGQPRRRRRQAPHPLL